MKISNNNDQNKNTINELNLKIDEVKSNDKTSELNLIIN